MNKKNIEQKIKNSFSNATPDMIDKIQSSCEGRVVNRTSNRRANHNMFWKIATCCLALVLVVTAVVGGGIFGFQSASASTVSLDVNPSVQIQLNRKNKVVEVTALNEDGANIISDMNFKGCDLKVCVNALIGSMLRQGYLTELANSVLVSVDSDKSSYAELANIVADEISVMFKQMQIDASVVKQWLQDDDEVAAIAKSYKISLGKAQLIHKISSQSEYTVEQLVELTVNDLSVLLTELDIAVDDVDQDGAASTGGYIGEQAAISTSLALVDENLTADSEQISKLKCKLDFEDGIILYAVEFVYGDYKYAFEIAAKDGAVIAWGKQLIGGFKPDSTAALMTEEEVLNFALENAGVSADDVQDNLYIDESHYYRYNRQSKVYEINFVSGDKYFAYEIANDGTVLHQYYELLNVSSINNYLERKDVDEWFFENNPDNFTRLDKLNRYRVTTQKTNDGLTYTVSFVNNGIQYTYYIDAITKTISRGDAVSYEDAVKENIKDQMQDMFDIDDDEFFEMFDKFWEDDVNFDHDDFHWGFEHDGNQYELEFDRWGNVFGKGPHGGPMHNPMWQ